MPQSEINNKEKALCFVQMKPNKVGSWEDSLYYDSLFSYSAYKDFVKCLTLHSEKYFVLDDKAVENAEINNLPTDINPNKLRIIENSPINMWIDPRIKPKFNKNVTQFKERRYTAQFNTSVEILRDILSKVYVEIAGVKHLDADKHEEAMSFCKAHLQAIYLEAFNGQTWNRIGIIKRDDGKKLPATIQAITCHSSFFNKNKFATILQENKVLNQHCFASFCFFLSPWYYPKQWGKYQMISAKEKTKDLEDNIKKFHSTYEGMSQYIASMPHRFLILDAMPKAETDLSNIGKHIEFNDYYLQKYPIKRYIAEFAMPSKQLDDILNSKKTVWGAQTFDNPKCMKIIVSELKKCIIKIHIDILNMETLEWYRSAELKHTGIKEHLSRCLK